VITLAAPHKLSSCCGHTQSACHIGTCMHVFSCISCTVHFDDICNGNEDALMECDWQGQEMSQLKLLGYRNVLIYYFDAKPIRGLWIKCMSLIFVCFVRWDKDRSMRGKRIILVQILRFEMLACLCFHLFLAAWREAFISYLTIFEINKIIWPTAKHFYGLLIELILCRLGLILAN
jgi:hypothetical protein